MRSPLAPTVYRRSRQQRGVVSPVFYISHAVTILTQKCTFKSKNLEFLVQTLHCTETICVVHEKMKKMPLKTRYRGSSAYPVFQDFEKTTV